MTMDEAQNRSRVSANYLMELLLAVCLGIYLFTPPLVIFPIGMDKLFAVFSVVYIALNIKRAKTFFAILDGPRFIRPAIVLFIVTLVITLIHVNTIRSLNFGYRDIYYSFCYLGIHFPLVFALFLYLDQFPDLLRKLQRIGLFTLGIWIVSTVFLILFPNINEFVMTSLMRFEEHEKVVLLRNRGFGFAQSHLFAFTISLALVFLFVLQLRLKMRMLLIPLLLTIPFLMLIIAFNARIGFVALSLALAVLFVPLANPRWYLYGILSLPAFGVGLLVFQNLEFFEFIPGLQKAATWIQGGIIEVTGQTTAWETGNLDKLFGPMWFFPSGLALLWGDGVNPFYNSGVHGQSDVGYVNQMFYGGFIYLGALLYFYIGTIPFRQLARRRLWLEVTVGSCLIGMLLLCNIKGPALASVYMNRIFWVFAFYFQLATVLQVRHSRGPRRAVQQQRHGGMPPAPRGLRPAGRRRSVPLHS